MNRSWSRRLMVGICAFGLLAAACGGDDDDTGGTPSPTDTETTASPTETATEEPTDGGGGGITVTQQNFSFTPPEVTVESGEDITVTNGNPSTPHTFTVEDIDVTNEGGQSTEVRIELDPGTYDFVCRFHESQGMTGTLIVTEST
jgi:plastocyanin